MRMVNYQSNIQLEFSRHAKAGRSETLWVMAANSAFSFPIVFLIGNAYNCHQLLDDVRHY